MMEKRAPERSSSARSWSGQFHRPTWNPISVRRLTRHSIGLSRKRLSEQAANSKYRCMGFVLIPARTVASSLLVDHTVPPSEPSSVASSCPLAIRFCNCSAVISLRLAVPRVRPPSSPDKRLPTAIAWRTLGVMKMTPTPSLRTRSIVASTLAVWRPPSAEVGSSRISTLAPKKPARAMATPWRSPPDKVPTACSGSRSRMPIRCISAIVTWFACRMSKRLNGPQPLVGSRPMKKLRVTDISGIIARSWNTVAMPAFMAWRGLSSTTSAPLTSMVPPEGLCTPDMVLMKVDLPAPLSPSRQWHSPAWMANETPDRAMMLPNRFSIARISTNGWGLGWAAAVISALPGHALADGVVEQHGHQQHRAQENQVPVLIDAGVGQPYHHHPEDDRTQECAHGRAVATGEQAAANQ